MSQKPKTEPKTNSEAEAKVKEDSEIQDQFDSTDTESPATAQPKEQVMSESEGDQKPDIRDGAVTK